MNNKNKRKAIHIKTFIIPFIIIAIIFLIVGKILIDSIKNHYYNQLEEQSINFARSYSHSLAKGTEAYEIVDKLLEDKLSVASKIVAFYDYHHSNEQLKKLADTLEVDEIYSYNPQGEIVFSNTDKYLGWKAYEGHPVYDFIFSNKKSLVEDIRQDTESGVYYKYGYFKAPDGCIIQIGVLADKIQNFLGGFEIQQLLDEMEDDEIIGQISFIDNYFNILASTDNGLVGRKITNQDARSAIDEDREHSFLNYFYGKKVYEVFIPVYFQNSKIGTLAIRQSLEKTEAIVRQVSTIGFVTLSTIFASLLYAMASTYNKNKKLIKLAYYDSLTGLPNKEYLIEFLTEKIEKNNGDKKALLLINCSNFRTVNLTFGFQYGDTILQELAEKLKELANIYIILFRFTSDKFVLYVDNYDEKNDLIRLANKINEIFNNPFKSTDVNQFIGAQVGIVEIDNNYNSIDQLLKDASVALTYIKDNSSANYAFFNEEIENIVKREEMIEKEIRTALSEKNTKKLYLEYQPQVDLKTNQIVGFEALARMKTKNLGLISPVEFIDIVERKQLMIPFGNWVLKTACNFIGVLNNKGYDVIKVAVNISGIQLMRDDFIDTVMDIIKETGIKESNLKLEITESIILEGFTIVNSRLKQLRDLGIEIALDDFGTGYSSLSRIRGLNIDCVKIDKYFISKIPVKDHSELITKEIISMCHKIGLTVIAEGVEVKEQRRYLVENHCDIMQGYLFSKPLSKEKTLQILKNNYKDRKNNNYL